LLHILVHLQGGWGWLVVGAAFLVQVLTTGLQLAFGVMAVQIGRHFRRPTTSIAAGGSSSSETAAVNMEAGQFLLFYY
jgi:hypothetical protein